MAETKRARWDSRLIFLFAAIGSAVGLGNLWRFPYLTYKFGGGAFLIPYLIILLAIGIPILILEFAIGQKMQKGAIGAFRGIDRRFAGIGVLTALICFVVVSYYAVVMGWSLVYMIGSVLSPLPWAGNSENFFLNNVLQRTDGPREIGSLGIALLISLAAVWICIFFCVFKGVKSVGKVVLISMPLPFIMLLILFLRAITLDGALSGISYYIRPDFSLMLSADLWLAAITQVFFSLSIGMGVMVAYASFNSPKQGIGRNAFAVALADTGLSLLAGFVVFGVLGHMALVQNIPIDEVVQSGPSLAFIVFPEALSLLPFAAIFSLIFFFTLFILGLDSAFSLVEGVTTVVKDAWRKISVALVAFIVCSLGFLSGFLFITGAGIYFLDIIDHYVNSYLLIMVGILQCIAIGWIYGAQKMRDYVNSVSRLKIGGWWNLCIKWIIPISLSLLVLNQLITDIRTPYGGYPQWAQMIGWAIVIFGVTLVLSLALFSRRKSQAS